MRGVGETLPNTLLYMSLRSSRRCPNIHRFPFLLIPSLLFMVSCEEPDEDSPEEATSKVTTLAGNDLPGMVDGAGADASFHYPCGMVADGNGNLYVADRANHSIRHIDAAGRVTTFAGTGYAGFENGHVSGATFNNPYGLARDAAGNLYVGDTDNHAIRKISREGIVTTLAGGNKGFSDRDGTVARFNHPHGVAVDQQQNVYVADSHNNRIRMVTADGAVSTIAGNGNDGFVDGTCMNAEFFVPIGIAMDPAGNLFVGDEGNSSIRKIIPGGEVVTLAGSGKFSFSDGVGRLAEFNAPGGIALDAAGNLFVADYFNNCIRKVAPSGAVQKIAGTLRKGFADGPSAEAQFYYPFGIAVDPAGTVYVGDQFNHRIRKISTR